MLTRVIQLLASLALGFGAALLAGELLAAPAQGALAAQTFMVNSAGDVLDAVPGDGHCETAPGNHICTLRAAIQEANQWPGADTIRLQPNTTYLLGRSGPVDDDAVNGDLDITDSVSLLGAGPDSSLIDASATDRVLEILSGTVVISGVTIQHGNSDYDAGGIEIVDSLAGTRVRLINSQVLSNTSADPTKQGIGIASSGALTISNSLIAGNTGSSTAAQGGGIFNSGQLWVISSTVRDNHVEGTSAFPSQGGGIFSFAPVTVINSTLSGNSAGQGGGIYSAKVYGHNVFINTTISGNWSGRDGGGLSVSGSSTDLFNTTITGNLANADVVSHGVGGGVYVGYQTSLSAANSIIAENWTVVGHAQFLDDCSDNAMNASLAALGPNLFSYIDPAHCVVAGTPMQGDPLLGPLQDNGGPTPTQALLPRSPAINAGTPSGCTDDLGATLAVDERGLPRAANILGTTRCDLGAYEVERTLALPLLRR